MKSKVIPAHKLVKHWLKRVAVAEGKLAVGRKLSSIEVEDVNLFRVMSLNRKIQVVKF